MCLAIPGKLVNIDGNKGYVEFGTIKRNVDLRLLEEVNVGDFVIVHAGFAIEKINEEEAQKTLKLYNDLATPFEEMI